jgi:hypothetical protein
VGLFSREHQVRRVGQPIGQQRDAMTRYWFGSFTGSGAAFGASGSGSVRGQ